MLYNVYLFPSSYRVTILNLCKDNIDISRLSTALNISKSERTKCITEHINDEFYVKMSNGTLVVFGADVNIYLPLSKNLYKNVEIITNMIKNFIIK